MTGGVGGDRGRTKRGCPSQSSFAFLLLASFCYGKYSAGKTKQNKPRVKLTPHVPPRALPSTPKVLVLWG